MNRALYENWVERLNALGAKRRPAFLLVDFEGEKVRLWGGEALENNEELRFDFSEGTRPLGYHYPGDLLCGSSFPTEAAYRKAFEVVQSGLRRGDSF